MNFYKLLLALCLSLFSFSAQAGNPVSLTAPSTPTSMVTDSSYGPYTYTLSNNVGQPVNLAPNNPITISGNATSIVSISNACPRNSQGYYVPTNGCTFSLTFAPVSSGTISDTVNVSFSGGAMQPTISQVIPSVSVSENLPTASLAAPIIPSSLVSGIIQTLTYTLTNTSLSKTITSIIISGYSGNVSLSNNTCSTLAAGASCTFDIVLAPEATDIDSDINQTISVTYGGAAPATSAIEVNVTNPTMIAVGEVIAGLDTYIPKVLKSSDLGATWTEDVSAENDLPDTPLLSAGGGAGTLMFAGRPSSGVQQYYNSGSGWSLASTPTPVGVESFAYGVNHLGVSHFIGATGEGAIWYSFDGQNWTDSSVSAESNDPNTAYGNGYYVGCFSSSFGTGRLHYTQTPGDASSWQTSSLIGSTGEWLFNVAYGAGRWVVVGGPNYPVLYHATSLDSSTWSSVGSDFSAVQSLVSVAYGNNTFVTLGITGSGDDTRVYTSTNGIDWDLQTTLSSFQASPHGLSYSASTGKFVAVGNDSKIYTSPNGTDWTQSTVTVVPTASVYFNGVASETQTYEP